MAEETPEDRRTKGERALQVFLSSQAKVAASTDKSASASSKLADAIGDGNDGLISAVEDLIEELQFHREAMNILTQALVKMGGINLDLGSILGSRRKR